MTIDASALITPNGPITAVLFPGTNGDSKQLEALVTAFLANAYADARVVAVTDDDAKKDRMAKALALYTAYDAVYQRMVAEPLTVTQAEKGSHGYSTAQIEAMKEIRDGYLAAFEDELPVEESVPSTNFNSAVPNRFTW